MSIDIFKGNFENLENIWNVDENGVEFIYARDLAKVLGYGGKDYWRNFQNPLEKAMITCKNNREVVDDHFAGVRKMVEVRSGAKREVKDYKLTRYACYLTAQNGDPRKKEVALAQNYFVEKTQNIEFLMKRANNHTIYELKFLKNLCQTGLDYESSVKIKDKGNEVLFGGNTKKQIKEKLGVAENSELLLDFLDPVVITAKKLAIQLSNLNIKNKNLRNEKCITEQHLNTNKSIRKILTTAGIYPENLPTAEDIKKVENRLNKDLKTITKPKKKSKDKER
jgi:DNA-damage-inducible protein D